MESFKALYKSLPSSTCVNSCPTTEFNDLPDSIFNVMSPLALTYPFTWAPFIPIPELASASLLVKSNVTPLSLAKLDKNSTNWCVLLELFKIPLSIAFWIVSLRLSS